MTKRMLIDASHPEETRVVVLDGNRLEAFDIESANRKPLKGNIYLARVVRVEPSLQAAFVEYGGNRHGFLAFGEIHPDYYQLPVADRQRLIEMQQAEAREEREREEAEEAARAADPSLQAALEAAADAAEAAEAALEAAEDRRDEAEAMQASTEGSLATEGGEAQELAPAVAEIVAIEAEAGEATVPHEGLAVPDPLAPAAPGDAAAEEAAEAAEHHGAEDEYESVGNADAPPPEMVGGGSDDDGRERRIPPRFLRHYKIQEVIKRRQIMLIQVVKEERGGKGAALTTYISLAGRFSVLMPNSPRGGGVSRKITSAGDRKRLREIIDEQQLPDGMSLIVRTAGAQRPKPEIKRDCEYLLRLWDNIRERTFASSAPALIYEEADLIKRSVRDVFGKDVEEVLVDGEDAYQDAREFMRMLMPQNASKVRPVRDGVPLFARHGVDAQLDAMHSPNVQLKSGGYIVINQTEALVAIDVNSGRATRERHIEDTAFRTNMEAADEIARQLRLRDLAGLIVIDFIDMESSKHDGMVERRLKDALKQDRARIQVGRISHFGLLEMSRQRLRPSIAEHAFIACPHCTGRGLVRSVESSGLQVLRGIEEEGAKRRAAEIIVHVASPVAFWLLNRKRERLAAIEARFGMAVQLAADDTLIPPALRIERLRAANPDAVLERPAALRMDYAPEPDEPELEAEAEAEFVETEAAEEPREAREPREPREARDASDPDGQRKRRRRRRRGGRRDGVEGRPEGAPGDAEGEEGEEAEAEAGASAEPAGEAAPDGAPEGSEEAPSEGLDATEDENARRRRRGRRGGRRRREEGEAEGQGALLEAEHPAAGPAPQQAPPPAPRRAPTPADPFAGHLDDIMQAMEAAEAAAEAEVTRRTTPHAPYVPPAPAPVVLAAPEPEAPMQAVAPVEPPAAVAEPVPAPVVEAVPEPVAAEPVAAPPVAPILLDGTAAAELPRKRGWWRK
jgi:ribonuclease E